MKRYLCHLRCFHRATVLLLTAPVAPAAETPPAIPWQVSFGGSSEENCKAVVPTADGGFLLGGDSSSGVSGNKTSAGYGGFDGWVVRVDADGTKLWERVFGGSGADSIEDIATTDDGGALLGMFSYSGVSGNKTSGGYGSADYWLVKVDGEGNKVWERSYGGASRDALFSMVPATDGGFLLVGVSESGVSGNKTSPSYGAFDVWLVKVDGEGNKQWDRSYGGTGLDGTANLNPQPIGVMPSADGGFFVGTYSESGASGNKTSAGYGAFDYWLFKVDASGNKLWDRSYGGSDDDKLSAIAPNGSGGFFLAGSSVSDISGSRTIRKQGAADVWLINVDLDGTKLWEKSISVRDSANVPHLVASGDGGVFLGWSPFSFSTGHYDYQLAKIDSNGDQIWSQGYGGGSQDFLETIVVGADGGLLLAGDSSSGVSGNKTSPLYGLEDFWVIKTEPVIQICTNCPPKFAQQPTNQLVLPGTNVTLAAAAFGPASIGYQWRFEGIDIPGATNASYSFSNVSVTNGHGNFSVVASNEFGSVTSRTALVFVRIRPVMVVRPSTQYVLQGQNATFTCVATGAPPILYRWIGTGFTDLSNTTGILIVTNAQVSLTNAVRCFATNAAGAVLGTNVSLIVIPDFDRDGMADAWETQYGFNTNNTLDATLDLDADGLINRAEYLAGTDPTDAASVLGLELVRDEGFLLRFVARANLTYTIQSRADLRDSQWQTFTNLTSVESTRWRQIPLPAEPGGGRKFYRLVTPRLP